MLRLLQPVQLQSPEVEVADVGGAAVDLLMQREVANQASSIIVISNDGISDTVSTTWLKQPRLRASPCKR